MVLKYLIMILKKRGYQGGKQGQKIDSTSKNGENSCFGFKGNRESVQFANRRVESTKNPAGQMEETNTEKGVGETKGTSKSPTVSIREPKPKPKSTKIFLFNNVTKRTVGFAIGIFLFIGIIIFPFVKKIYNHKKCRKQ